jgi:hypothetical protein
MLNKKESLGQAYYPLLVTVLLIASVLSFCPSISLIQSQTAAAQLTSQSSENFNTYQNTDYGIRMQYPSNWEKTEGGILAKMAINDTLIPIAEFHPPDQSVSVLVFTEKLLKNMTLDEYAEESTASLKTNQPDIQIIERNKTTLAGLPAHKIVLTGPFDFEETTRRFGLDKTFGDVLPPLQPINSTTMQIATIHGNNSYIIGYSDSSGKLSKVLSEVLGTQLPGANTPSLEDPFYHYQPAVQKMIESFELTTSPNIIPQPNSQQNGTNEDPMSILDQRLARGEISIEEYLELRQLLERQN